MVLYSFFSQLERTIAEWSTSDRARRHHKVSARLKCDTPGCAAFRWKEPRSEYSQGRAVVPPEAALSAKVACPIAERIGTRLISLVSYLGC